MPFEKENAVSSEFCPQHSLGDNPEEKFEALIWGKGLSEPEREALRSFYGLSCNQGLLSSLDLVKTYVVRAGQKIKGNSF